MSNTRPSVEGPAALSEALGIEFSQEQLDAITAPLEPGVIIAGAGTGKTTVMAARVVWLVGTGLVRPEEVLGLTFTRKAASELGTRIRAALEQARLLGSDADQGRELVMTYDAFAAKLVSEHGLRMGLETDPLIITGASRYRLAARVVASATGPFQFLARLRPPSITERLLQLDADLQSHLVSTHQLRVHTAGLLAKLDEAPRNNRGNVYADVANARSIAQERLELADLVDEYQRLKREMGLVEFADQLAAAAQLVGQAPSVSRLMRAQFKVVLLDEYQDTSSAQSQLLRNLFGSGHPVTAVGDPFQAIYGWRGAAASNITSFPTDFPATPTQPARRYQLSVNRRSQSQILQAANGIGVALRKQQAATGAAVEPLHAPTGADAGVVAAFGFETAEQETDWLADSLVDYGSLPDPVWSDVAVLVRRNADIPPLFAALVDREVPVEIVGLGGLLSLPEVTPVVATLNLLDDVTRDADLVALLSGPRWRIGTADLRALAARAKELGEARGRTRSSEFAQAIDLVATATEAVDSACLMDAVMDPGAAPLSPAALQRLTKFAGEFNYLQRHLSEPAPELTRRIVAASGLDVELIANASHLTRDPTSQLTRFTDAVADYVDVDGDTSLTGLVAYLQAEQDHGVGLDQAVPSAANSVKLMTVHKAKGLEWERVYLPGLADKVFPSDRVSANYLRSAASIPAPLRGDAAAIPQLGSFTNDSLKSYATALRDEQLLAEDRLAYVAATRAKSVLIASWHIWEPDRVRPRQASPYFDAVADIARRQGSLLQEASSAASANPVPPAKVEAQWPAELDAARVAERLAAAEWVQQAIDGSLEPPQLTAEQASLAAFWDETMSLLIAQAQTNQSAEITAAVPQSMSATGLLQLRRSASQWAAAALRPMPRKPAAGSDLGTRFHEWVQARAGLQPSLDLEGPGPRESDIALQRLCDAFDSGPYADRQPLAVEVPFVLSVAGHQIRGRIDAIYPGDGGSSYQVVDWKTSGAALDPIQLAIYRLAWAQANGVSPGCVDAVFYVVRSAEIVRPQLPDTSAALAELIWPASVLP